MRVVRLKVDRVLAKSRYDVRVDMKCLFEMAVDPVELLDRFWMDYPTAGALSDAHTAFSTMQGSAIIVDMLVNEQSCEYDLGTPAGVLKSYNTFLYSDRDWSVNVDRDKYAQHCVEHCYEDDTLMLEEQGLANTREVTLSILDWDIEIVQETQE